MQGDVDRLKCLLEEPNSRYLFSNDIEDLTIKCTMGSFSIDKSNFQAILYLLDKGVNLHGVDYIVNDLYSSCSDCKEEIKYMKNNTKHSVEDIAEFGIVVRRNYIENIEAIREISKECGKDLINYNATIINVLYDKKIDELKYIINGSNGITEKISYNVMDCTYQIMDFLLNDSKVHRFIHLVFSINTPSVFGLNKCVLICEVLKDKYHRHWDNLNQFVHNQKFKEYRVLIGDLETITYFTENIPGWDIQGIINPSLVKSSKNLRSLRFILDNIDPTPYSGIQSHMITNVDISSFAKLGFVIRSNAVDIMKIYQSKFNNEQKFFTLTNFPVDLISTIQPEMFEILVDLKCSNRKEICDMRCMLIYAITTNNINMVEYFYNTFSEITLSKKFSNNYLTLHNIYGLWDKCHFKLLSYLETKHTLPIFWFNRVANYFSSRKNVRRDSVWRNLVMFTNNNFLKYLFEKYGQTPQDKTRIFKLLLRKSISKRLDVFIKYFQSIDFQPISQNDGKVDEDIKSMLKKSKHLLNLKDDLKDYIIPIVGSIK